MIADSYNEFLREQIFEHFSKKEAIAFMEESEKHRPTVIRVNTLLKRKHDIVSMLTSRGMDLESLPWTDFGLIVFSSAVPIGATPEYLAGYYTIQGASSMLPVINMDIGEGMSVVDLCAAPGGKSTHIAALLNNTGTLYANDANKDRIQALKCNLQRMGVQNCIVTNLDGRKFHMGLVDRVLLDAPCMGTGVISKDPSVKVSKSLVDLKKTVLLQKELIINAFDMLKPGGIMVYSTCSVLVKENEEVVDYLLLKRPCAKIKPCEIDVGKDGFMSFRGRSFNSTLSMARRLFPHVHNMDGFFYAKIMKVK